MQMTKRAQRLNGSARLGPCLHCLHFLHHDLLRIHRIFFEIRISFLWFRHLRHLVVHFPEPRSRTTAIEAGRGSHLPSIGFSGSAGLWVSPGEPHQINIPREYVPTGANMEQMAKPMNPVPVTPKPSFWRSPFPQLGCCI